MKQLYNFERAERIPWKPLKRPLEMNLIPKQIMKLEEQGVRFQQE